MRSLALSWFVRDGETDAVKVDKSAGVYPHLRSSQLATSSTDFDEVECKKKSCDAAFSSVGYQGSFNDGNGYCEVVIYTRVANQSIGYSVYQLD